MQGAGSPGPGLAFPPVRTGVGPLGEAPMPTEVWRAGDYRVCPKCGARHKVQDLRCTRCDTVLAGTPVFHSAPTRVAAAPTGSGRGMRALLAITPALPPPPR